MFEVLNLAVTGVLLASLPPPTLPVSTHALTNGLTVLVSEDHALPVVAVEVRYLVGSGHEKKGRSGFAHLFEHLMFQGSEHYDHEYFAPFEPAGGTVNGTTNEDRTNFFERVPSNYLDLALFMESDRMAYLLPALTQQKLDNQRDVVKNERRQSYENRPYGMANTYLVSALFPDGHPYHEPVIGSHADLTAATLGDVKQFFGDFYGPANAVLTIVGDVTEARALELADHYFGALPAGRRAVAPLVPAAPAPPAAPTASEHLVKTDDVKLPRVHLAWRTPALFAAGDAELDLLSGVLTSGKTSRLYKPLVYDKKVASDVAAYQASMRAESYYVVEATAAPGVKIEALAKALGEALTEALATPPSEDELLRARNDYRKGFYGRVESVLSRAWLLSTYYHFTGSADYLARDFARYAEATASGVQEAGKRWLPAASALRLDIVPSEKGGSE